MRKRKLQLRGSKLVSSKLRCPRRNNLSQLMKPKCTCLKKPFRRLKPIGMSRPSCEWRSKASRAPFARTLAKL
ncbi:MAG: hypothetical protein ACTS7D_01730 [Candidatus Hodgkinia cicadicola]